MIVRATQAPSATPIQMPSEMGPGRSIDSSRVPPAYPETRIGIAVPAYRLCTGTVARTVVRRQADRSVLPARRVLQVDPYLREASCKASAAWPVPGRAGSDAALQQGGPHGPLVARIRGEVSPCRNGRWERQDAAQREVRSRCAQGPARARRAES